ncbi:PQQ-dependent sugar dehydrogenase [Pedococcus soli]
MRVHRSIALAAVAVIAVAAPVAAATALADPIPSPIPVSNTRIALKPVATGLVAPVTGAVAPGDHDHLYIADQGGQIWQVDVRGRSPKTLVADLSARLVSDLAKVIPGLPYDERGLLGLAFDPGYKHNGLLYTFTSENPTPSPDFTTQPGVTPGGGQTVIAQWKVRNARAEHPVVDPSTRRELMRIDKPQFNHNGGEIAFGPDGKLYIAIGDGGAADDQGPGHVAGGNAQSLAAGNVLGKVLRIDPHGHNSANGQYGIPRSNPFVGREGADEIWAYGFRNPYRFSFDSRSGRLVVGEVGQNDIEEVDVVRPGRNYGWPVKEGSFLFDNGGDGPGFVTAHSPGSPAGLVDPVLEYDHTAPGGTRCGGGAPASACQGIAVVGGYVYRGHDVKALRGHYVFGDYSRAFAQPLGRLFVNKGSAVTSLQDPGIAVFGFAQDRRGELYVLGNTTGVLSGTTGTVLRITRP